MSTDTTLMTIEEFLALPDDGVERWLIKGELREGDPDVTRRNRRHSRVTARVARLLDEWVESQPVPRGEVVAGEAGFRLRSNPDAFAGIDVAYVSPELAASTVDDAVYFDGVPVLAVEILSPSDTHERVSEKIGTYLEVGVALVWLIDPDFRTVRIHRQDDEPELLARGGELDAEPHLPGFRVPVARLFE